MAGKDGDEPNAMAWKWLDENNCSEGRLRENDSLVLRRDAQPPWNIRGDLELEEISAEELGCWADVANGDGSRRASIQAPLCCMGGNATPQQQTARVWGHGKGVCTRFWSKHLQIEKGADRHEACRRTEVQTRSRQGWGKILRLEVKS